MTLLGLLAVGTTYAQRGPAPVPAKERALQGLLLFVIALPGLAALTCLGLSFAFGPEAVAAGEHLGPLQGAFAPCPGCSLCGMSRAFAAFSHGSFAEALAYNRGVVLGWPLAWLTLAVSAFGVVRTMRDAPRFFTPALPLAQEMPIDVE